MLVAHSGQTFRFSWVLGMCLQERSAAEVCRNMSTNARLAAQDSRGWNIVLCEPTETNIGRMPHSTAAHTAVLRAVLRASEHRKKKARRIFTRGGTGITRSLK